jgi:hypothetical protein
MANSISTNNQKNQQENKAETFLIDRWTAILTVLLIVLLAILALAARNRVLAQNSGESNGIWRTFCDNDFPQSEIYWSDHMFVANAFGEIVLRAFGESSFLPELVALALFLVAYVLTTLTFLSAPWTEKAPNFRPVAPLLSFTVFVNPYVFAKSMQIGPAGMSLLLQATVSLLFLKLIDKPTALRFVLLSIVSSLFCWTHQFGWAICLAGVIALNLHFFYKTYHSGAENRNWISLCASSIVTLWIISLPFWNWDHYWFQNSMVIGNYHSTSILQQQWYEIGKPLTATTFVYSFGNNVLIWAHVVICAFLFVGCFLLRSQQLFLFAFATAFVIGFLLITERYFRLPSVYPYNKYSFTYIALIALLIWPRTELEIRSCVSLAIIVLTIPYVFEIVSAPKFAEQKAMNQFIEQNVDSQTVFVYSGSRCYFRFSPLIESKSKHFYVVTTGSGFYDDTCRGSVVIPRRRKVHSDFLILSPPPQKVILIETKHGQGIITRVPARPENKLMEFGYPSRRVDRVYVTLMDFQTD